MRNSVSLENIVVGTQRQKNPGTRPMKLICAIGGVMRWQVSVLCALLSVYSAGAHASDKLRVGKPTPNGFDFAILDVGVAKGFYKQQDLEIEPVVLEGSAKVTIAITSGSIDISLGTGTDFSFVAKGAPERGVAAMAGPPLNMAFLVRSNDGIRSVSELKGKKVAVSTVGSLLRPGSHNSYRDTKGGAMMGLPWSRRAAGRRWLPLCSPVMSTRPAVRSKVDWLWKRRERAKFFSLTAM
jgi:hypothetical protein